MPYLEGSNATSKSVTSNIKGWNSKEGGECKAKMSESKQQAWSCPLHLAGVGTEEPPRRARRSD